jgi:hypothetical protein
VATVEPSTLTSAIPLEGPFGETIPTPVPENRIVADAPRPLDERALCPECEASHEYVHGPANKMRRESSCI